jgi:hypothetical protein
LSGLDIYDPAKMMAAYHASTMSFWTYYVFSILTGILTLIVTVALQERMGANAPHLMRLAVIAASVNFALVLAAEMSGIYRNVIVAQLNDASTFRAFLVLHEHLAFAGVNALGWGLLFIGWAILRTGALSKMLGYIILADGLLSISQFAFSISQFVLGTTVWSLVDLIAFVWLGVALLRKAEPQPAAKAMAAGRG